MSAHRLANSSASFAFSALLIDLIEERAEEEDEEEDEDDLGEEEDDFSCAPSNGKTTVESKYE